MRLLWNTRSFPTTWRRISPPSHKITRTASSVPRPMSSSASAGNRRSRSKSSFAPTPGCSRSTLRKGRLTPPQPKRRTVAKDETRHEPRDPGFTDRLALRLGRFVTRRRAAPDKSPRAREPPVRQRGSGQGPANLPQRQLRHGEGEPVLLKRPRDCMRTDSVPHDARLCIQPAPLISCHIRTRETSAVRHARCGAQRRRRDQWPRARPGDPQGSEPVAR